MNAQELAAVLQALSQLMPVFQLTVGGIRDLIASLRRGMTDEEMNAALELVIANDTVRLALAKADAEGVAEVVARSQDCAAEHTAVKGDKSAKAAKGADVLPDVRAARAADLSKSTGRGDGTAPTFKSSEQKVDEPAPASRGVGTVVKK